MNRKRIPDPVYHRHLTLVWGCDETEFCDWINKRFRPNKKLEPLGNDAMHLMVGKDDEEPFCFIWIGHHEFYIKDYGRICHEVVHFCCKAFERIGMAVNRETEEALAYYLEYIYCQILKALRKEYEGRKSDEP